MGGAIKVVRFKAKSVRLDKPTGTEIRKSMEMHLHDKKSDIFAFMVLNTSAPFVLQSPLVFSL